MLLHSQGNCRLGGYPDLPCAAASCLDYVLHRDSCLALLTESQSGEGRLGGGSESPAIFSWIVHADILNAQTARSNVQPALVAETQAGLASDKRDYAATSSFSNSSMTLSSFTSTDTLPPLARRPNNNSSARALRMVSCIRRAIGRAPINGSKPLSAR